MTKPPFPPSTKAVDIESTSQELRRLAEFSRAVAAAAAPAAVIDLLWQQLTGWYPAFACAIALYQEDSADREIIHTSGPGASRAIEQNTGEVRGAAAGISGSQGTVLEGSLVVLGRRYGLVAVASSGPRFTPHDIDVLDILLSATANALANLGRHAAGNEATWNLTVDAVPTALCTVAADGRVHLANRAFADLIGRARSGIVGERWTEVFPQTWQSTLGPMLEADYCEGPRTVADRGRRLNIRTVSVDDAADSDRIVLIEDHTEQHRLQEQLVQSEKMSAMGQLIAGVAHDLNNPLASVVGFADYLMESPSLADQHREPLRVIQQEAERAAKIVKNLLTFARKHEGPWRPTVVSDLLKVTSELMRNDLASRGIELIVDIEPGLPELDIEPTRIQQVIVNLVTNAAHAIEATERAGRILIRARKWTDGIAVDVSDNGPGIPQAERDKIFDPFYTTKPEGTGTGLGLSISQGIVKEHGGRISLVGSGPHGTMFRIELPGTSAEYAIEPAPAFEKVEAGLHILVVDDEPHILHYMHATLEGWGHSVKVAHDGVRALQCVADDKFDVIITDLRMPNVNGREFYEALQRDRPELVERIVFSTGDTVRDDTLEFLEAQGRPCLQKPFSLVELRQVLCQLTSKGCVD
ncbi:MAG: ATP-binding protein [Gemmatimonadales bacterium]